MLPLIFFYFSALLCVYRLNKIQMSESTREGPLLHSQSIDVCLLFLRFLTLLFYYHLLCIHIKEQAMCIVVVRKAWKIYSIETK